MNKTMEEAIGEISGYKLECLISTAFSYIGYWAELCDDDMFHENYKEAKEKLVAAGKEDQLTYELVIGQILLDGKSLKFMDVEDNSEQWEFTLDKLKKGLELWILNPRYHNELCEWWEGDAEAADIIMQLSLFEDVIYG